MLHGYVATHVARSVHEARNSGWSRVYARVVEGGEIATGDTVELVRAAG